MHSRENIIVALTVGTRLLLGRGSPLFRKIHGQGVPDVKDETPSMKWEDRPQKEMTKLPVVKTDKNLALGVSRRRTEKDKEQGEEGGDQGVCSESCQ